MNRGGSKDVCVHRLFEKQAAGAPDAVAVVCGDARTSYGELNRRANQIAHHLRRLGVARDEIIGVCVGRSSRFVEAILGILKAECAYLPLDADYPAERLAFMISDARAAVVLAGGEFSEKLPASAAKIVCLDDGVFQNESSENLVVEESAEDLAYVIYTSGSTGTPKGVAVPHRAVVRLVVDTDYVQFAPDDVVAQVANCSFDAVTFEIWGPLLNGGSLAIIPRDSVISPCKLVDEIQRHHVTTMFLTAALFNQAATEIPDGFRSLRFLSVGGEALDPRSIATVLRAGAPRRLLNGYGPTETTTFAMWHEVQEIRDGQTNVPLGKPIAGTQIHVLDENRQPVSAGETGELYISGAGVARGYLHRPELTAEKFVTLKDQMRAYRTGDLVRVNKDGNVEFLGRIDFQVKIRGFRIELGEIEATLTSHPAVRAAAVLAREDQPGDKRLVAYVTTQTSTGELRDYLRAKLPEYMVPVAFVTMDRLPLTPNGKLDRDALPAPVREAANAVEPSLPLERDILKIWQHVLRGDRIGVEANFFDVGGNSLQLAQVHTGIEKLLERAVPITALFQFPTVRGLATHLSGERATKTGNPFLARASRQRAATGRPLSPT
ncbi:MAG: hypothetical protein QOD99_1506 [Chthoniobacter sp.]|jgi:amino acid adenylation domain-containing protein|nr:hypothetical protein [Chthoniobacter sp.]